MTITKKTMFGTCFLFPHPSLGPLQNLKSNNHVTTWHSLGIHNLVIIRLRCSLNGPIYEAVIESYNSLS